MNAFVALLFVAASASAGHWHSIALQGPSSKTALTGPDGSHIVAAAPGGSVHHEITPGVVAHAGPVLGHASVLGHAPVLAHAAPIVAHAAPWAHGGAVLAGPAGLVATHGLPLAHAGLVAAHGLPLAHAGSGWEGQWAPDHSEALYDDGSYKPHVYGH